MPAKHLVLVHGRSTKPRRAEKERYVRTALLHGLKRVSPIAAGLIESGEVKTTCVYYGDICNELLCDADPRLRQKLTHNPVDGIFYEADGCYDKQMAEFLKRPTSAHTKEEYRKLVRTHKDQRFMDDLVRVISPILANGLSRKIMLKWLPDLGAYVTSHKVGSKIRQRLQGPLLNALTDADDVAIVSHSMGCIATYDVLWKFSHMSEYEVIHNRRVTLWITLGSPLGEPAVRESLYDAHEPEDGIYPRNVVRWLNIAAYDDFIAHDATAEDDFKEMKELGCRIVDLPRIHTFWVGATGSNPHKFYGYLDHPVVAEQIAAWTLSSGA
ncbi:MAG: hypothetical protein ABR499_21475 [Gemmatimonadaceae bacterium]